MYILNHELFVFHLLTTDIKFLGPGLLMLEICLDYKIVTEKRGKYMGEGQEILPNVKIEKENKNTNMKINIELHLSPLLKGHSYNTCESCPNKKRNKSFFAKSGRRY